MTFDESVLRQSSVHVPPRWPSAPTPAYAGCHSMSSLGTAHFGLSLCALRDGSSTGCISYGVLHFAHVLGERSAHDGHRTPHPHGGVNDTFTRDAHDAQSPPLRTTSSRCDSGCDGGSHGGDAVSYTHLTLPTIYSV